MNRIFIRFISLALLLHVGINSNAAGYSLKHNVVIFFPKNINDNLLVDRDTSLLPKQSQTNTDSNSRVDLKSKKSARGFNAKGFFLGLLLNVFGLIYVYFTAQDKDVIRWAWVGLGAFIVSVWVIGGLIVFLSLPV